MINKREYSKIKQKIIKLKKENDIPTFRFKKMLKPPTFKPQIPDIATI